MTGGISGLATVSVQGAGSGLVSRDGTIVADFLNVGDRTEGEVRLELRDSAADVGMLRLGAEATLVLDVAGLSRYSVIATDLAMLDGTLDLDFASAPAPGVYDLIVSSGVAGIEGDFARLRLLGAGSSLSPEQYSAGVTQVVVGGVLRDVYRLTIVPEPGTALLLGLGLSVLARSRPRTPRA